MYPNILNPKALFYGLYKVWYGKDQLMFWSNESLYDDLANMENAEDTDAIKLKMLDLYNRSSVVGYLNNFGALSNHIISYSSIKLWDKGYSKPESPGGVYAHKVYPKTVYFSPEICPQTPLQLHQCLDNTGTFTSFAGLTVGQAYTIEYDYGRVVDTAYFSGNMVKGFGSYSGPGTRRVYYKVNEEDEWIQFIDDTAYNDPYRYPYGYQPLDIQLRYLKFESDVEYHTVQFAPIQIWSKTPIEDADSYLISHMYIVDSTNMRRFIEDEASDTPEVFVGASISRSSSWEPTWMNGEIDAENV